MPDDVSLDNLLESVSTVVIVIVIVFFYSHHMTLTLNRFRF